MSEEHTLFLFLISYFLWLFDSILKGTGASLSLVTLLCSYNRHFTLTMYLSTIEYIGQPDNSHLANSENTCTNWGCVR